MIGMSRIPARCRDQPRPKHSIEDGIPSSRHGGARPRGGPLLTEPADDSLANFADEIVRLADLVGTGPVAVGTDMDGNYRPVLASYPISPLPQLLGDCAFSDTDTGNILGTNARSLLRTVTAQPSSATVK